jgi:glycine C-acetyltransferase
MDDCHGIGVCGRTGRGTAEHYNVLGKVTITSGTLGKAIGGATGGYISGPKGIITYLRQKSRPYTFSNSIPPSVVYASIKAFGLLSNDNSIVERLHKNTDYFRREIKRLGFTILEGTHPIVPVMVGEAEIAQKMSIELLKKNIYVKGLWFPVVPRGEARLRVQISASHKKNELDKSLDAFNKVGKEMGVIY